MAIRVTLRKADRDVLASVNAFVESVGVDTAHLDKKQLKQWAGFYERVLSAELAPKKGKDGSGVSVRRCIEIFRGVLSRRLIMPAGEPSQWWFIRLQNKLNASGITEELAKKAAEVASVEWRGNIKVESIINQVDSLCSESTTSRLGSQLKEAAEDMDEL